MEMVVKRETLLCVVIHSFRAMMLCYLHYMISKDTFEVNVLVADSKERIRS